MNKKQSTSTTVAETVRTALICLMGLFFCCSWCIEVGARTIAYDDFNDGSFQDGSPHQWTPELNPVVNLHGGDVTIAKGNCCGGLGFVDNLDSSVSLRTQARVHSGLIGLTARWRGGGTTNDGYFAWIAPDGSLDALTRVNGVETEYDSVPLVAPKLLNEDIIFQMDLDGTTLSARYWPVSQNPPLQPQWSTELSDEQILVTGQSGVYVGAASEASEATIRYVHLDTRPILITYDDFADGNDRGWRRVQNISAQLGGGNYSVENGEYRMQSGEEIPSGTGAGSAAASMFSIFDTAAWRPTQDGPDLRNGVFRTKVRANQQGTTIMNGMRNEGGTTTYAFFASTDTGQFSIGSFRGSIPSTTHALSAESEPAFQVGQDWILESVTLGDRITLKYWLEGSEPPETPQLVFLDPAPLASDSRSEVYVGGFVDANHPTAARLDMSFDDTYFRFVDGWTDGDFSVNEQLDAADIDRLNVEIRSGMNNPFFDLNSDGAVNATDRVTWVTDLKQTFFGDANFDGEFDSGDLTAVFQTGQYEDGIEFNSTWSSGDWNGDGEFDTGDLTAAFQDGGYGVGPRSASMAVPEPPLPATRVIISVVGILMVRLHLSRCSPGKSNRCEFSC